MAYIVRGVDPATYPPLAEIEQKTGRSNVFRTMAYVPRAMEDFFRLYTTLLENGDIDRRLKEMVYLAVSFVNEADYCANHHTAAAKAAGLSEEEIDNIRRELDEDFSPREQTALLYARELTRTADVEDDTRYRVESHFSNEHLVELTMVIALANFTNRFANGIDVPLETDLLRRRLSPT